ncbi:unnamed protein product, partial [Vitis vinifera]|uniref:Uncharacterized protein n=1 Tax=Vitis vinifera TaxID=29760 RepID=D7SMU5_VITVI
MNKFTRDGSAREIMPFSFPSFTVQEDSRLTANYHSLSNSIGEERSKSDSARGCLSLQERLEELKNRNVRGKCWVSTGWGQIEFLTHFQVSNGCAVVFTDNNICIQYMGPEATH